MYSMISYWLKYYRHSAGLTQQQVADNLKIERSTYTYYETGKTKPDINTLVKIAKVFNIDYTCLLEGVDSSLEQTVSDVSSTIEDEKRLKYRTHATTKYETDLLFIVRNLSPKQRKEVLTLAKSLVAENCSNQENPDNESDNSK